MRKLVVLLFMLLAFQQAALAEDSHNFFDRTNLLLHGVNTTAYVARSMPDLERVTKSYLARVLLQA